MTVLAAIAETDVLAKLVLGALVAGIGITSIFGLVIYGSTRFADLRREGRSGLAGFFAVVAALGFVAFTASVIYGITLMTQK